MRLLHPLRGRSMALLWAGLSFSAVGDQLYAVALTWIAVGVLGSNAGYLGALQASVALLAVLGIGKWADRWEHLRGMIGADLARAAVLLAVVAAASLTGRMGVAALVGAIVVLALGQAVFQPALQTVLPTLVPDLRQLPAANALLDATDRIARLLGPGIVALCAAFIPMLHFLTLDAASFLASAAAVLAIRRRVGALRRAHSRTGREPVWRGIKRGWRATAAHPLLCYTLAVGGMNYGAWYAVMFLGLPLMLEHDGAGPRSYGLILATYGCTNLAANVVFGGRTLSSRPQFQMLGGLLVVGSGLVLVGLAGTLPAQWRLIGLAAAAGFAAVGGPMKDIPMAVLRQIRLNAADMPAATRIYMAMSSAALLIAMLLAPAAFARFGTLPVIVACGGVYLATGAFGLIRYAAWRETGVTAPAAAAIATS